MLTQNEMKRYKFIIFAGFFRVPLLTFSHSPVVPLYISVFRSFVVCAANTLNISIKNTPARGVSSVFRFHSDFTLCRFIFLATTTFPLVYWRSFSKFICFAIKYEEVYLLFGSFRSLRFISTMTFFIVLTYFFGLTISSNTLFSDERFIEILTPKKITRIHLSYININPFMMVIV